MISCSRRIQAVIFFLVGLLLLLIYAISSLYNPKFQRNEGSTVETTIDVFHRLNYEHFQRRLPQCIIIGSRKSGTRALLRFLSAHPRMAVNHEEMHFFDRDENYARGLEWYRSSMPLSIPGTLKY